MTFLFLVSGFSGLIYESLWTHYLKLFLGHAALAQTLVLSIFMGGMAVGAWGAGRLSRRWPDPLLSYARVEAVIGVAALVFHMVFVFATNLAFDHLFPAAGSAVGVVKWSLAGLLILPQSILLGATFPLMATGLLRRWPSAKGSLVAGLYFANSLGGAIGILIAGFVLIDSLGLPGAMSLAGALNLMVAAGAARVAKAVPCGQAIAEGREGWSKGVGMLLLVALGTGLSSFVYEVAWIRMLSLVLGASTHAFELMLAAFILGLALGGWWIQRRGAGAQPERPLALAQLAMGTAAVATLALYSSSFDLMAWLVANLPRDDRGYGLFNLASHGIALMVMLPATTFAGMTLPLITEAMLRRGGGEGAVGATYAANTIGGILGVTLAVHVGLPALGLKGSVVAAGAIDLALGAALLIGFKAPLSARVAAVGISLAVVGAAVAAPDFNRHRLASGTYREGELLSERVAVLGQTDGRTASISLLEYQGRIRSIRTNGKVDGSIAMSGTPSGDETTMIMAAAIPLALHPQAKTVANIGFGTGMTTTTLLAAPGIERVDTIEIEEAMVELAKGFRPVTEAAYSDPRSHIHLDDAKSYFAGGQGRWDIIISEPSNPWVSGVAGLFSEEFYHLARRHLADDGVLVQWMQAYEIETPLVMSVLKALSKEFGHWQLYAATPYDLLIVARPSGSLLPAPGVDLFAAPALAAMLARTDAVTMADIANRRLGGPESMGRLAAATPIAANSDYAPVIDQRAARTRFLRADATSLLLPVRQSLPVSAMLEPGGERPFPTAATPLSSATLTAEALRQLVIAGRVDGLAAAEGEAAAKIAGLCAQGQGDAFVLKAGIAMGGLLSPERAAAFWSAVRGLDCLKASGPLTPAWIEVFEAMGARDGRAMAARAERLLPRTAGLQKAYLARVALLGHVASGNREGQARLAPAMAPIPDRMLTLIGQMLVGEPRPVAVTPAPG